MELFTLFPFIIFGFFLGLISNIFGFGGGIFIVPLILWTLQYQGISSNYSMHNAIFTSLAIMIITSLNSSYQHHKKGHIIWSVVFQFCIFIAGGSLAASLCLYFFTSKFLKILFILYLTFIIVISVLQKSFINLSDDKSFKKPHFFQLCIYGFIIGFISSLLGVGGSIMTVPLLRKYYAKMKNAVATAIPLTLPVALTGSMVSMTIGTPHLANLELHKKYFLGFIYLPAFIGLSIGNIIAAPLGAKLASLIPDKVFAKIYIGILACVLVTMLMKLNFN